jgi:hypothetical protein
MKRLAAGALNLVIVTAIVILAVAVPARAQEDTVDPEMTREARMIRTFSRAPRIALARLPGFPPEAVNKILAFRKTIEEFESVKQIQTASGLSDSEFEEIKKLFVMRIPAEQMATPGKSLSSEGGAKPANKKKDLNAGSAMGSKKSKLGGPARGKNEPEQLDLSVKPHFYYDLPGIDLKSLSETQRTAFLEVVNREFCSCGCKGETLGFCYVNDPGCAVIKARVKKLFIEFSKAGGGEGKP